MKTLAVEKILVTRLCWLYWYAFMQGFIRENYEIIGLDNLNDYYSVELKKNRLSVLSKHKNFIFLKVDISKRSELENVFKDFKIIKVVNLAAQAGVRYSLENPNSYIKSNVLGL